MSQPSRDVIVSLAAKLDSLNLNRSEQSVLDSLFERAAAAGLEVEGFLATESPGGTYSGTADTAFRLGLGIGVFQIDSIGPGVSRNKDLNQLT